MKYRFWDSGPAIGIGRSGACWVIYRTLEIASLSLHEHAGSASAEVLCKAPRRVCSSRRSALPVHPADTLRSTPSTSSIRSSSVWPTRRLALCVDGTGGTTAHQPDLCRASFPALRPSTTGRVHLRNARRYAAAGRTPTYPRLEGGGYNGRGDIRDVCTTRARSPPRTAGGTRQAAGGT